ncbi:Rv3235 family protein [Mumia quercus]|uniref:Rv3235 family protein n=1 Tax=Mumia quercus TaxID=2976125 RepID=UPI0021D12329|nr:Rv3235 family protein [Mumia quercus]
MTAAGTPLHDLSLSRPRSGGARPAATAQWSLPLVDGSLALSSPQVLPSPPRPHLSLVPPHEPGLDQRAATFVRALLEVSSGSRPLTQLARVLAPEVYDEMQKRVAILARARTREPRQAPASRLASIRVTRPRTGAAEIAARIAQGDRSRALAARLVHDADRRDPTWVCTALCWV